MNTGLTYQEEQDLKMMAEQDKKEGKVDWGKFKCRCSGISKIMSNKQGCEPLTELQEAKVKEFDAKPALTDKQREEYLRLLAKREASKQVVLSDTCIEYLMESYAWETQGMISVNKESMEVAQLSKGKMVETESVLLLMRVDRLPYQVHKERISNDFLSGEIDIYLGEHVYAATNVTDIKSAFDYPGFLKKINNGLERGQTEQVQGYGDISGARDLFIANCLVDNPESIIEDMKFRLARKLDAVTVESPDFLREWEKWEKSMRFSHIPTHQRVHKIKVEPFTTSEQQKVYDRVKVCRDFLWKFDESYQKMNK
jgi:hypothetical protein